MEKQMEKLKELEHQLILIRDDLSGYGQFMERNIRQAKEIVSLETRLKKATAFIDMINSQSQNWDKFCDCGMTDNIHDKECMTIKMRIDEDNLES